MSEPRICKHEGWPDSRYGETGPCPEPAEMIGPCEHNVECPTCKLRMRIQPCGHRFNDELPMNYRIAVNGPMEVR